MPRKPRDPSGAGIHTAIRLPPELHEKLKVAAGEGSISNEIRDRLAISLGADEKTRELLETIVRLIWSMEGSDLLPWHQSPYAYAVLRAEINLLMDTYRPAGEPVFERRPDAMGLIEEGTPPEQAARFWIGVMLAARGGRS